jgi:serine/threonine protein phosphatase PrpC
MDYNEILMTLITAVVIPGIVTAGIMLRKYIEAHIKDANVRKYLALATDCVTDAVADVSQTVVDKVKDEEWNDKTKNEAFEIAKEKALQHLGITGKSLLEEALGDFDGWINSKIEAEVKRLEAK